MIKIKYFLSLPAVRTRKEVRAHLKHLRWRCQDLGFESVSAIGIQRGHTLEDPGPKPAYRFGFVCKLGDGAKDFSIMMGQYQNLSGRKGVDIPWFSRGDCAPATANERQFRSQYLAVIEALTFAQEIGFTVEVKDEGSYWKNHNVGNLLALRKVLAKYPDPRDFFLAAKT